jgi:hypothetical protein
VSGPQSAGEPAAVTGVLSEHEHASSEHGQTSFEHGRRPTPTTGEQPSSASVGGGVQSQWVVMRGSLRV